MAEKMKACQVQSILVKNPEKDIDIDFKQELSADKSVKSNQKMEKDLQNPITDFADFKKYVLEVFATLHEK